jgi:hypothetical protein
MLVYYLPRRVGKSKLVITHAQILFHRPKSIKSITMATVITYKKYLNSKLSPTNKYKEETLLKTKTVETVITNTYVHKCDSLRSKIPQQQMINPPTKLPSNTYYTQITCQLQRFYIIGEEVIGWFK